jgi:general secretion pathway protein D
MSNNITQSNRGVPFAKDLPIVGNAFKTQSVESTKTELVVMVTPRIADDDNTTRFSQALTDSFNTTLRRSRFGSYTLTPWAGVSVFGGRAAMRSDPKLDAPRPAPKADD